MLWQKEVKTAIAKIIKLKMFKGKISGNITNNLFDFHAFPPVLFHSNQTRICHDDQFAPQIDLQNLVYNLKMTNNKMNNPAHFHIRSISS